MSTRVGGIEQFAAPLHPNLETLVRNLERDTARSKRLIRQFMEGEPDAFLRSALQVLKTDVESRGAQFLLGIVIAGGLLLPALCDLSLTKEQALAVAQAASRLDPNADIALARTLADSAVGADGGPHLEQHARLMEVLASISDGARIFPSLVRLLRHSNAHIRSKAVLMIGRGNRSAKWLRQRLADADARIRANAAEALWGVQTDEARELLQSLVHDSNNRVAGNAILGLYRLGDNSMIPEILAMTRHASALFRATAAWVMGESGDPRFTEIVAGLLREPHAVVRKRAFAALGSIRASVAQAHQGQSWRVGARILEADTGRPSRRVLLGLTGEDGATPPALLPTQIIINEDGQNISQYRVVDRALPETVSVVFLLAPGGAESVLSCLPWKRAGDLWASLYYTRDAAPASHAGEHSKQAWVSRRVYPTGSYPRFQSSADAITADLERIPPAEECAGLWRSIGQAVNMDTGPLPGKRHVIIFSEPGPRTTAAEELVSAVAAAQALVQVVSPGPDPALEDFCRRVNGVFWRSGDEAAVRAYINLFARYEVIYTPPNPEARNLKLRLHGPGLCAETALVLAAPA